MQYQALRKEASSKLLLFAAVSMILLLLSVLATLFVMAPQNSQTSMTGYTFSDVNLTAILILILVLVMLPVIAVTSLPVIGLFLIYSNARSGRPLKTTGYSLLRGYMFFGIVAEAFLLALLAVPIVILRGYSLSTCLSFFSMLLSLLTSIASVSVLKTAKEVVVFGYTYRKVSAFLPVMLILSLCLSALSLLLTVLANTVPALTVTLADFRITTAPAFYVRIVTSALGLLSSFLFLLLSFRGKKALTQQRDYPVYPIEQ